MSTPILSVDELCVAAEATLKTALPPLLELLDRTDLGRIKEWQQLPDIQAISTANTPAAAITSAGLTGSPTYSRATDTYAATWRLAIGIYDRGKNHAETQKHVRDWCACIRLALQGNPTLGGFASAVTWIGEEFDLIPNRDSARTVAIGAVAVDVTARMLAPGHLEVFPVVESTFPVVTVHPPHQE